MCCQNEQTPFWKLIGRKILSLSIIYICLCAIENNSLAAPYTVILDPGHGGEDTGAKAKHAGKTIYEKNITLAIAQRIEWLLKDRKYWAPLGKPVQVLYTRKNDKTVSLQERSNFAKNRSADLFLSIHVNSETTGTVSGIETFFLKNDEGSASKLAEIQSRGGSFAENHGYAKEAKDPDTALLINSVAADATVDASKQAADLIHTSSVAYLERLGLGKKDRGVKQTLLFVLLNAQTPAVLFEAFYLSHPKDLAFVSVPENRQKIAEGITRGILRFLALR